MSSSTLEKTSPLTLGNEALAVHVVNAAIERGVKAFCLCPGSRNSPIVTVLRQYPNVELFFLFEERCAAFFALGRARRDDCPVAVVVTSGTAAGELLPAAMEAYYTGVPLLLITADRPRRFRGTCAPQAAEQVGIFGIYAPFDQDIAEGETCLIGNWNGKGPAHLNVRFEDPFRSSNPSIRVSKSLHTASDYLDNFLSGTSNPFVIVSALPQDAKNGVIHFIEKLNAPVMLEAVSGLREEPRLSHLKISRTDNIWNSAAKNEYPIDGVLRIGGIPTFSGWRDLENMQGKVNVCSLSEFPFSGLSWADIAHIGLEEFFSSYKPKKSFSAQKWLSDENSFKAQLQALFLKDPRSEMALVHELSKKIPIHAHIYLGNSLPIREWDLASTCEDRKFIVTASRGLNGIDGQISTFLGQSVPEVENWAILGDLTTLYDMPGPWVMPQLKNTNCTIVVINNSGGQIFSRFFADKVFLHAHELSFEPLANMWGLKYERWTQIPPIVSYPENRLIEIVPDNVASEKVWKALK